MKSVADAMRAMHAEKVGAVMVPDAEGCPVGIFTERRRGSEEALG